MAYVQPVDISLNPNDPLTAEKLQALRDNPEAIVNGDTGAPRIQEAAYGDLSIPTSAIQNDAVTSAKIDFIFHSQSLSISPNSTLYYELIHDKVFMPVSLATGSQFVACSFAYDQTYGKHIVILTNTDSQTRTATLSYYHL